MPGSASMAGSSRAACSSASARSAVCASSGPKTSVCRHVMIVSRPNTVMNHGMPAAGSKPTPSLPRMRSAARSATERAYACARSPHEALSCGTCRFQASSERRMRSRCSPKWRARGVRPGRTRPVCGRNDSRTSHSACGPSSSAKHSADPETCAARELRTSVASVPAGSRRWATIGVAPAPSATGGGSGQRARGIAEREVVLLDREDVGEVASPAPRRARTRPRRPPGSSRPCAPAGRRSRSARSGSGSRRAAARPPAGCAGRRPRRSTRPCRSRAATAARR